MPNAINQTFILLGLVNSSLITLEREPSMEPVAPAILYGCGVLEKIITEFKSGPSAQPDWIRSKWMWCKDRINSGDGFFSTSDVCNLGHMIAVDLMEEITDPGKREMMEEILLLMTTIDNHIDPDGTMYESLEEISATLDDIYREIGFVKEGRYQKHLAKLKRRAGRNGSTQRCSGLNQNQAQLPRG